MSRKRVPLNQNECTADFRIGVPFEQNLQLSKYERDVTLIKVDILKKIAAYFNVTTDYLLGVSDVKRDLNGQMKMNEVLDEYYDLVEVYKELDPCDQEMIWSIIQIVKKTSEKKKSANMQKRVE